MALASQAVLATTLALEEIPGVACHVTAFPGPYHGSMAEVLLLKDWTERAQRVVGRFLLDPRGATPLASTLWRVAFELIRQPAARRLMVVATDGDPDDWVATRNIIARCRAGGLEVIGLGIGLGEEDVRAIFGPNDAITIQKITDLAPALFGLLERRLLA